MENLNLVNTKYAIEMLRNHGVSNGGTLGFHAGWCDIAADQLESALALIKSQDQRIKELTEENERLREECGNQSVLWRSHFESIYETAKEIVKADTAIKIIGEILSRHTPDIDGFFTMHESELVEFKKKFTEGV